MTSSSRPVVRSWAGNRAPGHRTTSAEGDGLPSPAHAPYRVEARTEDQHDDVAEESRVSKQEPSRVSTKNGLDSRSHGIAVTNVRFGFVDTKMAKAVRKPLIMTVDRAAGHLLDCLETRPIQLSRPSVAAGGVLCARWLQTVRVWWS